MLAYEKDCGFEIEKLVAGMEVGAVSKSFEVELVSLKTGLEKKKRKE